MENFIAKGQTFPSQEWWDEKKTDVSFLYNVEEEPDSQSNSPEAMLVPSCGDCKAMKLTDNMGRSEGHISRDAMSKLQLDSWMEAVREEKHPKSSSSIKSLAGFVNVAYPIMGQLHKTKDQREPKEVKTKQLKDKVERVTKNLYRVIDTINQAQKVLAEQNFSHGDADILRKLFELKTTKLVRNYDAVNVLMNLVTKSTDVGSKLVESESCKTFGSSVDLV